MPTKTNLLIINLTTALILASPGAFANPGDKDSKENCYKVSIEQEEKSYVCFEREVKSQLNLTLDQLDTVKITEEMAQKLNAIDSKCLVEAGIPDITKPGSEYNCLELDVSNERPEQD